MGLTRKFTQEGAPDSEMLVQTYPLTFVLSTVQLSSTILGECSFMNGRIYLFIRILLSRYHSLFGKGKIYCKLKMHLGIIIVKLDIKISNI